MASALASICNFFGNGVLLGLAALGVFLWLLIGMIFYRLINNCKSSQACIVGTTPGVYDVLETTEECGWTIAESFYYSVQTGLNIGFGVLAETRDGSRLYSCYHLLAGASFIGGAISLFASKAMDQLVSVTSTITQQAHDAKKKILEEPKNTPLPEVGAAIVKHPRHARTIIEKHTDDDAEVDRQICSFEKMPYRERVHYSAKILSAVSQNGHLAKLESTEKALRDQIMQLTGGSISGLRNYFCKEFPVTAFITSVWALWILIGVVYGLTAQEWTFIKSLYFAISTLSTAGLQGVTADEEWHFWFVGIYALIGVPLYGMALGLYANCLVSTYQQQQTLDTINGTLTLAECDTVEGLLDHHKESDGTDKISEPEFIILELMRLGSVNYTDLVQLKDAFAKLDKNNSGRLNRREMWPDLNRDIEKITKSTHVK